MSRGGARLTPDQRLLRRQLRPLADAFPDQARRRLGLAYNGPADFVLRHGRFYPPAPTPAGVQRGVPRACYANAIAVAATYGYPYVQGFATNAIVGLEVPVPHAWNAGPDGSAVDVTWWPPGTVYLGVELSYERADEATWFGDADPIDDWKRDFPLLREPWTGETGGTWQPSPGLLALRARLEGRNAEALRLYAQVVREATAS